MEINNAIRFNVMKLRNQKGWSQDELAIQMNKTRTWVTHIESGRTKMIKPDYLEQLAKVFKVSPAYLISPQNNVGDDCMLKIEIETDGKVYWITGNDNEGYFFGDDFDTYLNLKDKSFRQVALENGAEMDWNDQIAMYEYTFENKHDAINVKKFLEKHSLR